MCTVLTTGPQRLILLLNRGKGIEFNAKINFVDNLGLDTGSDKVHLTKESHKL